MLSTAHAVIEAVDAEEDVDEDDALDLAEGVQALDSWIRGGGFLPEDWELEEGEDDLDGEEDGDDEDAA